MRLQLMNNAFRQVLSKKKFARHEYGQVGVYKIRMRSLIEKL